MTRRWPRGVRLPGLKGYWRKPDEVSVNEAGVPTYTWTLDLTGCPFDKPIRIAGKSPAPRPPRES